MPSHYDPEKKCRVGVTDEVQFYSECARDNGDYFRKLMAAWTAAGGELKWGAGGAGLRGQIGDKKAGVCFLAPAFGGKQDRIELACTTLGKQIGEARCQELQAGLRKAAGDKVAGNTMISIIQPGSLSASGQKMLTLEFIRILEH